MTIRRDPLLESLGQIGKAAVKGIRRHTVLQPDVVVARRQQTKDARDGTALREFPAFPPCSPSPLPSSQKGQCRL